MKKYKKKIIITGALGQDGIILSKLFIKNKFQVFGFVKKIKKYRFKNVKYLKTSLTNFHTLSKKIKYINPDIFIHLGTDNPNFLETKKKYSNKKNFKITKNIIDFFSINKVKTPIGNVSYFVASIICFRLTVITKTFIPFLLISLYQSFNIFLLVLNTRLSFVNRK